MKWAWMYPRHDWDWNVAKWNRHNFGQYKKYRLRSNNWFYSIGCDEDYRRTLVVHLPFDYSVVFAISRRHPEWEEDV